MLGWSGVMSLRHWWLLRLLSGTDITPGPSGHSVGGEESGPGPATHNCAARAPTHLGPRDHGDEPPGPRHHRPRAPGHQAPGSHHHWPHQPRGQGSLRVSEAPGPRDIIIYDSQTSSDTRLSLPRPAAPTAAVTTFLNFSMFPHIRAPCLSVTRMIKYLCSIKLFLKQCSAGSFPFNVPLYGSSGSVYMRISDFQTFLN